MAISGPKCWARIAVAISLTIFRNIAIGIAERKRSHFLGKECVEMMEKAALSAKSDVRDRMPEHASTTWRLVLLK